MADYNARIAPFIDITFYVTSVFGIQPSRTHRGLDIATARSAGYVPMYSMCNGTVIRNRWDDSYGNYLILKDNDSGIGFLFAHMNEPSPLQEGDSVVIGQYIGDEGTTGNSTGIHLHLEMQDISENSWEFNADIDKYINPAEWMGFPNTQGISVIYDGTPIEPPTPSFIIKKKKFPWVLYARKLRNKRSI